MATHFNLSSGDIIPQPDFAVTRNENGGFEASRSYYMLKTTWDNASTKTQFAIGQAVTTADSTIDGYYDFLRIQSISPQQEPGQHIRLIVNYTGIGSAQYGGEGGGDITLEALPTYRMDGRMRELPFSDHPKYQALSDEQRWLLGGLMDGKWETDEFGLNVYGRLSNGEIFTQKNIDGDNLTFDAGDSQEFAQRISRGQVTYQAPALTWTEYTQGETGMTSAQLGKLGEIATPRGNPPSISGYNWMLTSASQEQRGQLYQTTLEWTLSTPDGWDSFLYTLT